MKEENDVATSCMTFLNAVNNEGVSDDGVLSISEGYEIMKEHIEEIGYYRVEEYC